jgi:hypothetical protein
MRQHRVDNMILVKDDDPGTYRTRMVVVKLYSIPSQICAKTMFSSLSISALNPIWVSIRRFMKDFDDASTPVRRLCLYGHMINGRAEQRLCVRLQA